MRISAPAPLLALMAALIFLTGCDGAHLSFLDPQGPVAAQQRTHFLLIFGLVMIVVVPVLVVTPLLLWRYRYDGRGTYRPRWDFAWGVEVAIWGVPVLVVTVLTILLWRNTTALDPFDPLADASPPLPIQVVGYDWKWLFIYPDQGIASVGKLVVPAGRPIAFDLTSDTVMQSFWIPALGSQIYAMGGGMVTRLHLLADAPGTYRGLNTQYNGKGFHEQTFIAQAVSPTDFDIWAAKTAAEGLPLDQSALQALSQRNTVRDLIVRLEPDGAESSLQFSRVPDNLFNRILATAPSPEAGGIP